MISNLISRRLLSNLIRFSRHTSSLARNNKKPNFLECPAIRNLNALNARSVAVTAEKKEEDQLNLFERLERDVHELSFKAKVRRVNKESIQNVFDNLKKLGEIQSHHILLLLKCCTKISFMCSEEERIKMATEFWDSAEKFGIKFDISHFNELLSVYVANNHKVSYEEFLDKMKNAGVEPDLMTFRYLLRASCQQGDIDGAKNLLDKMKSLNIPVDTLDFNSLILAYSKIGDFEKVNEILKIMNKKALQPTTKSYVYLLCGYIKYGNLTEFEKLFNELPEKKFLHLSNGDLFEIVYSLALNNQESYIDMVMERISSNVDNEYQLNNCIQRLLHKKLDSTALKLVESIDLSDRSFNYARSVSKNILDHFVWYRKPKEVLNICRILEEKGYASASVGYCLKRVFSLRDTAFFKDFISQMKAEGLPVRPQYYWPVIIQESKKGNEALESFLKQTPISVLENADSVYKFILPNYVLSENLEEDFEKLAKAGIPKFYTARYILNKLLMEKRLDDAEKLVSTCALDIFRIRRIFNFLVTACSNNQDAVQQVVNILYCLYHDVHLFDKTFQHSKDFVYFDNFIDCLLNNKNEKEVVMRILQAMFEKKMGLSSKSCSMIVKTFPDQDVKDLTAKFLDSNLKIEINEDLLTLKSGSALEGSESPTSLQDCIGHMLRLAENGKFRRALEVGERFLKVNKEIPKEDIKASRDLYRRFLFKLSSFVEKESLIKNTIDLGSRLGVVNENSKQYNYYLFRSALASNYTSKAFELFKEILLTTQYPILCERLLINCISNGETEKVQQITKLVTETLNRNAAYSYLIFALVHLGEIDKAKKVLDTPDFVFQKNLLLKNLSRPTLSKTVKSLTELFKDVNNFDKIDLYKILIKNHAFKNEIKEIENLWLEIQNKNISDKKFLEAMSNFELDKNTSRLYNSIDINIPKFGLSKWQSWKLPYLKSNLEDRFMSAMTGTESPGSVSNLAINFASLGDVDKICTLLENYSIEKSIQKIAAAFLSFNKVNKYLTFLEFFASKGDFIALNECFKVGGLISVFKTNENFYRIYKSLLHQCADETNFTNPIVCCFVICAKLPGKVADAEEVIDKYNDRFKEVPFSQIKEMVEMTEYAENFYENILSSKKLKNFFSDNLHEFYNKIITLKYEGNELEKALQYMNEAEVDKVKDKLEKKLVYTLTEKLAERKGKMLEETQNVCSNVN